MFRIPCVKRKNVFVLKNALNYLKHLKNTDRVNVFYLLSTFCPVGGRVSHDACEAQVTAASVWHTSMSAASLLLLQINLSFFTITCLGYDESRAR